MKHAAQLWIHALIMGISFAPLIGWGQPYEVPTFVQGVNLSGWGFKDLGGLVVDAQDNVYAAGYFYGQFCVELDTCINSAGEADMFVISLDPAGNLRWIRTFGGAGNDKIMDMQMGSDGYLYLAGGFSQTVQFDTMLRSSQRQIDDFVQSDDACWMRMDTSGQLIDMHVIASAPWAEMIHTISIVNSGRVAIGGTAVSDFSDTPLSSSDLLCTDDSSICLTMDTIHGTSFFVMGYDETQQGVIGKATIRGKDIFPRDFTLGDVIALENGKIMASGTITFLIDSDRNTDLLFPIGGNLYSPSDTMILIGMRANQSFAWQGDSIQPGYFLTRINQNGVPFWNYWTEQRGVLGVNDLITHEDIIYSYGTLFSGFIRFNLDTLFAAHDLFLVTHDSRDGSYRWGRTAGFPQVPEYALQSAINHKNQLVIGFSYVDCNTHLDSLLFTNYACGQTALGLAWMTPDSFLSASIAPHAQELFSLYPNPCDRYIHLNGLSHDTGLEVHFYDRHGRERQVPKLNQDTYDTRALSPGLYIVQGYSPLLKQTSTASFIKQP